MEAFHRKGDPDDLECTAQNYANLLGYVDRLGDMIAEARSKERTTSHRAVEAAA